MLFRAVDDDHPGTEDIPSDTKPKAPRKRGRPSKGDATTASAKKRPKSGGTARLGRPPKALPFRQLRETLLQDAPENRQDLQRKLDPVLVQPATGDSRTPDEAKPPIGINQNLPPVQVEMQKRRNLRSHGTAGLHVRSELAPYFSNYDELISVADRDTSQSLSLIIPWHPPIVMTASH